MLQTHDKNVKKNSYDSNLSQIPLEGRKDPQDTINDNFHWDERKVISLT